MQDHVRAIAKLGSGSLLRDFFGRVQCPGEFEAGRQLALELVLTGEAPELALLVARATDQQRGAGVADQAAGAMEGVLCCLDALQAGGGRLSLGNAAGWPRLAVMALQATGSVRRAMLRMTATEDYGPTLVLLCAAARAAGPYLKRAEPAAPPAPERPTPAPTPLSVSVALQWPEGPLPMAIVSQPATRTVGTVERGDDGRISTTTTVTTCEPVAP